METYLRLPPLEEMAGSLSLEVKVGGVGTGYGMHKGTQVGLRGLYEQVIVIAHEHERIEHDVVLVHCVGEKGEELLIVPLREENLPLRFRNFLLDTQLRAAILTGHSEKSSRNILLDKAIYRCNHGVDYSPIRPPGRMFTRGISDEDKPHTTRPPCSLSVFLSGLVGLNYYT